MRTFALVLALTACGAGARKPCDWYFASERANVTRGPIAWLSGVWKGDRKTGDWIWTPLRDGAMAGVWRRSGDFRFYTLRQNGAKLVLVELSPDGLAATYDAVEQGERAVVFANTQRGRLGFREVDGSLEWTVERTGGAPAERHRLLLEI